MSRMITLALTGGVATGKSTFAEYLLAAWPGGVRLFDCDRHVHALQARPEVARRIAAELREDVVAPSGGVDREKLRSLVFRDPGKRRALEGVLHPMVREACAAARQEALAEGAVDVFVADVPLLYESGFPLPRDLEVVVACGPATQRRRLLARNRFTPELADHILASQIPILDKVNRAGVVIWNGGSREALRHSTEQFVLWLKSKTRS